VFFEDWPWPSPTSTTFLHQVACTSRNQPKCNHSIYDYMRLIIVCDYIWEYLQLQDQLSTILVIFTTMMQLLEISSYWLHQFTSRNQPKCNHSILLVASILHLFSSINRLICPISCNSHQISCILKVFYNDIGVYFNVCTKIIYI
jgi:hypothetical protein